MVCMTQTYIIATSLSCVKLVFRADGDSNIGDILHLDGGLLNQNLTRNYLDPDEATLYKLCPARRLCESDTKNQGCAQLINAVT